MSLVDNFMECYKTQRDIEYRLEKQKNVSTVSSLINDDGNFNNNSNNGKINEIKIRAFNNAISKEM